VEFEPNRIPEAREGQRGTGWDDRRFYLDNLAGRVRSADGITRTAGRVS